MKIKSNRKSVLYQTANDLFQNGLLLRWICLINCYYSVVEY